ncbi:MAG: arsenic transporter [Beijerinckiaceae bacterium]|nr:arsenic transporter [Beijerinckiaceae bacterium]
MNLNVPALAIPQHSPGSPNVLIWVIAALAFAGVILRPFRLPEWIWAVSGALLLVATGALSPGDAATGAGKGLDVYLFLTGMMLLAEVAREEGLFDWLAALATLWAKGSAGRLFLLIYIVGAVVTVFLSNDATAVVLTPAVAAAVKSAKVKQPLPYLLICAFIANAASFVLPISNPANLVIYGNHMPPLMTWLARYLAASVVSIAVTYWTLRWTQRGALGETLERDVAAPRLSATSKMAGLAIVMTAVVLLVASAMNVQLGLPTAVAGIATTAIVFILARKNPWIVVKDISWGVIPLVAGLFILVDALDKTGVIKMIGILLGDAARQSASLTATSAGAIIAFASNLMNNLPAGLIAASAVQQAHVPDQVTSAILIGVDLGPNLSITGSLATILWLTALRREGLSVSFGAFLKIGLLVMPPALLLSLATVYLSRG